MSNSYKFGELTTHGLRDELSNVQLLTLVKITGKDYENFFALDWKEVRAGKDEDVSFIGARRSEMRILLQGWAYRYKLDLHGKRQIVGLISSRETANLDAYIHDRAEYGIAALTPTRFASTPLGKFRAMARCNLGIMEAIVTRALIDSAVLMEWAFRLGSKTACQRVAHLLCEIASRIPMHDDILEHPLTQVQMADILGLSHIHVNRVFRQLRSDGLVTTSKGAVRVRDYDALARLGEFDPKYLNSSISAATDAANKERRDGLV